jgi:heat shock protein HslJ
MHEQAWLRWTLLGLAVVAGFVLIVFAVNEGAGDIEGTSWSVEQLAVDGSLVDPIEGTVITADFEDGGVSGIASCNNYFGSYETDGDSITFGPMGTTLMACEDAVSAQEIAYLSNLGSADTFDVDGDTLTLSQGDTVLVVFTDASSSN